MALDPNLEPDPEDETLPDLTADEREERARIVAFLSTGRATGVTASLGLSRRALLQKIERYRIRRPRRPGPTQRVVECRATRTAFSNAAEPENEIGNVSDLGQVEHV
jgi:hypothetical protein